MKNKTDIYVVTKYVEDFECSNCGRIVGKKSEIKKIEEETNIDLGLQNKIVVGYFEEPDLTKKGKQKAIHYVCLECFSKLIEKTKI